MNIDNVVIHLTITVLSAVVHIYQYSSCTPVILAVLRGLEMVARSVWWFRAHDVWRIIYQIFSNITDGQ